MKACQLTEAKVSQKKKKYLHVSVKKPKKLSRTHRFFYVDSSKSIIDIGNDLQTKTAAQISPRNLLSPNPFQIREVSIRTFAAQFRKSFLDASRQEIITGWSADLKEDRTR